MLKLKKVNNLSNKLIFIIKLNEDNKMQKLF